MAERANAMIRKLARKARPGVSDSQLADVLLDAFCDYYDEAVDHRAVLTLAENTLRRLEWSAPRSPERP